MAESVAGLCSEKQEFRRLILRYAPNGQVTSLTKELFKPCGSFDYEKRASTSIRRSMDTRRPNVQARSPPHPASHGACFPAGLPPLLQPLGTVCVLCAFKCSRRLWQGRGSQVKKLKSEGKAFEGPKRALEHTAKS